MKGILCLDDDNGILFHSRRQSQDRLQRQDLQAYLHGRPLFMTTYSYQLYQDIDQGNIVVCEEPGNPREEDAYYLFENDAICACLDSITELVVYRWNRRYPADIQLSAEIFASFGEKEQTEFPGSSHDKITRVIYERRPLL